MNFNVAENLGAVDRAVSSLQPDGELAHAVTLARSYQTDVNDLWDAVTSADRIPRWFLPITGDLELGGSYQLEGNAGGRITACQPPSSYDITWEFAGFVTWVDVRVSAEGPHSARFSITHTAHHSEHWDTFGPGATGVGFEMGLLGLYMHLTDPDQPRPDPLDFAMSPDGKALLTGSGRAWGEAAIAAGADPELARAAAARTIAFYTGEEADAG
ncbi:MAG: polyketide cyclase [Chloroflexi bacterium]|nr:polyketide cyclase [Chloroflexota bacterium]